MAGEEHDDLRWEDVGAVTDWEPDSARQVRIGARRVGVYRVRDEWFAMKDICPHAGLSICAGADRAGAVDEAVATCSAHGWRFDLRTGEQVDAELLGGGSRCTTYPVRIAEQRVLVGV